MFSLLSQSVCDLLWTLSQYWCALPRCRLAHRLYVILFDPWTMSIWLWRHLRSLLAGRMWSCLMACTMLMWLFLSAPTECKLSCLIPGRCSIWLCFVFTAPIGPGSMWSNLIPSQSRSDSNVFSLLSQNVGDSPLLVFTILMWFCHDVAAPTDRMLLSCLILRLCRSDSVVVLAHFCRAYVILFNGLHNANVTLFTRSHRRYVILFDLWRISIWLYFVFTAAPTERMLSCLISGRF